MLTGGAGQRNKGDDRLARPGDRTSTAPVRLAAGAVFGSTLPWLRLPEHRNSYPRNP